MMEQKILEGNKLIAEFMGLTIISIGYYGRDDESDFQRNNREWIDKVGIESVGDYAISMGTDYWFPIDEMPYHSSWDWLMPVVAKIEADLITNIGIFGDECKIVPVYDIQFHHQGPSKIEATYATVIDFITSLNTQTGQQ